ncbi:MAG: cytochrome c1 [Nitrospirota bacterium]|nr:cytochrome c1 [Nitrospirota bacterium]
MTMIMTTLKYLVFCLLFLPAAAMAAGGAHITHVDLDLSNKAVERGRKVFEEQCSTCHSMVFLNYKATMDPELAAQSFGKEPPDLSMTAKAKGKRTDGAQYIHALLTSYYTHEDGRPDNKVFPNIAMPNPGLTEEASRDVAAFLWWASEPSREERKTLGKWVIGYMVILTGMLYVVNKRTWKDIKKKG